MTQILRFIIALLIIAGCGAGEALLAQEIKDPAKGEEAPTFLLRLYEDNDFLNDRGLGTDDAYTNGTRIDLFYTKKHPSRRGIDRLLPKAGDSSVDVYGWGIMQLMFTPEDISRADYQPDDYPYSGALIATHTLYSYNPVKKFDWQTELEVGVLGPGSMAHQLQSFVHHLIHYQQPMGWSHQFRNDLLANINVTTEKQLAAWGQGLEIIGGAQVYGGTMLNGAAVYPLIRIGKMTPYFQGYIRQYSSPGSSARNRQVKKWQAYFIIKPEAQLFFTNALLEGGMFTGNPNMQSKHPPDQGNYAADNAGHGAGADAATPLPYHGLETWVYSINYGAVVSSGNLGISFTQSTSSAMMKGLYCHEVGNISLYFAW